MAKLRSRLFIIGGLVLLSVWALIPADTTQRVRDATTGRLQDTTIRRVPLNLGLDLQGGIHLALEVDQSKGPVPDPAEAIHRAERVVRTRIDEFGTTEPVVQVVGNDRLIVELAGEKDPARAKGIIQRTAFLEFRITDMKNLFRDALPEIDKTLRRAGVKTPGQAGAAANVTQLFGADTGKGKAKNKSEKTKAAAKDTTELNAPGPLASLLYQGQLPGEFLVPEEQVPVAESLLARPEVQRLIPRGIELKWGTEVASRAARTYRALYAVEDRPIITGEELEKAQAQRDPMTNQSVVNFTLSRRGTHLRARDRPARAGLHGHHPRRPRAGPAARHQESDRAARPDRAGREAAPGRAGPGAGVARRRAARAAHHRRGAHYRSLARQGLDQRRHPRRRRRRRAGDRDHDRVLPAVGGARRVGPGPVRAVHARRARVVRVHADAAR